MFEWMKKIFKDMDHEKRIVAAAGRLDDPEKVNRERPAIPDTVDCETCGCMIRKEKAIRGKSKIMGVPPLWRTPYWELYTPYYCRRCAPKKPVVKKAKKK